MIRENDKNGRVFDVSVELKDNAMLKIRPELFDEWDFEKNDELGLDIYNITKGSEKIVWWKCSKCDSGYDMMVNIRFYNNNCPYCTNRRANSSNSIASIRPDLAVQWHPTKNGNKTPHDVAAKSSQLVWWQCNNGHEWDARASDRSKYESCCCAFCINKKVLIGYNDFATTHPDIAKLLLKEEDGYKYTYGSKVKVDWKCHSCDLVIEKKPIEMVSSRGLFCPNCSASSMKYPERVMFNLLKEAGIDFSMQKIFIWSDNKKYDFYISSLNCLIELQGEQHYNGGFSSYGGRTLEEEQENDKYKYELAMDNGIINYIVIDCRYSDFEYIKNNIINSELVNLIDLANVDWDSVNLNSLSPMNVGILKLWNDGMSVKQITIETKLNRNTVARILKNFDLLGKCKYDPQRGRKKRIKEKE